MRLWSLATEYRVRIAVHLREQFDCFRVRT